MMALKACLSKLGLPQRSIRWDGAESVPQEFLAFMRISEDTNNIPTEETRQDCTQNVDMKTGCQMVNVSVNFARNGLEDDDIGRRVVPSLKCLIETECSGAEIQQVKHKGRGGPWNNQSSSFWGGGSGAHNRPGAEDTVSVSKSHSSSTFRRTVFWMSLDLSENSLSDRGIIDLVEWLMASRSKIKVRALKLYRNRISQQGAAALANFIVSQCWPIEELHLSHNQLDDSAAVRLLLSFLYADAAIKVAEVFPWTPPTDPVSCPYRPIYPRIGRNRGMLLPVWLRLEYNFIESPSHVLATISAALRSLQRLPNDTDKKADSSRILQNGAEFSSRAKKEGDNFRPSLRSCGCNCVDAKQIACMAERNGTPAVKDPCCSPSRCAKSSAVSSALFHLYSFMHQTAPQTASHPLAQREVDSEASELSMKKPLASETSQQKIQGSFEKAINNVAKASNSSASNSRGQAIGTTRQSKQAAGLSASSVLSCNDGDGKMRKTNPCQSSSSRDETVVQFSRSDSQLETLAQRHPVFLDVGAFSILSRKCGCQSKGNNQRTVEMETLDAAICNVSAPPKNRPTDEAVHGFTRDFQLVFPPNTVVVPNTNPEYEGKRLSFLVLPTKSSSIVAKPKVQSVNNAKMQSIENLRRLAAKRRISGPELYIIEKALELSNEGYFGLFFTTSSETERLIESVANPSSILRVINVNYYTKSLNAVVLESGRWCAAEDLAMFDRLGFIGSLQSDRKPSPPPLHSARAGSTEVNNMKPEENETPSTGRPTSIPTRASSSLNQSPSVILTARLNNAGKSMTCGGKRAHFQGEDHKNSNGPRRLLSREPTNHEESSNNSIGQLVGGREDQQSPLLESSENLLAAPATSCNFDGDVPGSPPSVEEPCLPRRPSEFTVVNQQAVAAAVSNDSEAATTLWGPPPRVSSYTVDPQQQYPELLTANSRQRSLCLPNEQESPKQDFSTFDLLSEIAISARAFEAAGTSLTDMISEAEHIFRSVEHNIPASKGLMDGMSRLAQSLCHQAMRLYLVESRCVHNKKEFHPQEIGAKVAGLATANLMSGKGIGSTVLTKAPDEGVDARVEATSDSNAMPSFMGATAPGSDPSNNDEQLNHQPIPVVKSHSGDGRHHQSPLAFPQLINELNSLIQGAGASSSSTSSSTGPSAPSALQSASVSLGPGRGNRVASTARACMSSIEDGVKDTLKTDSPPLISGDTGSNGSSATSDDARFSRGGGASSECIATSIYGRTTSPPPNATVGVFRADLRSGGATGLFESRGPSESQPRHTSTSFSPYQFRGRPNCPSEELRSNLKREFEEWQQIQQANSLVGGHHQSTMPPAHRPTFQSPSTDDVLLSGNHSRTIAASLLHIPDNMLCLRKRLPSDSNYHQFSSSQFSPYPNATSLPFPLASHQHQSAGHFRHDDPLIDSASRPGRSIGAFPQHESIIDKDSVNPLDPYAKVPYTAAPSFRKLISPSLPNVGIPPDNRAGDNSNTWHPHHGCTRM